MLKGTMPSNFGAKEKSFSQCSTIRTSTHDPEHYYSEDRTPDDDPASFAGADSEGGAPGACPPLKLENI